MQFHLNGFRAGDPHLSEATLRPSAPRAEKLPDQVDVLIVGCGPAGLTLAAQLSAFSQIEIAIVDQKSGPLLLGQADGIACRTMEMFESFGFSERVLNEAYWVNETVFWKPDSASPERIIRDGRVQDVEDGLSEFPHVILNQARVHDFYLELLRNSANRIEPHYGRQLMSLERAGDRHEGDPYPLTATFERTGQHQLEVVRARYVVGCDGARSAVRPSIGQALRGESANQAWGVMDVLAVSDFPDIRMKALIQSAKEGSVLIIPREGGYLVRLYVELDKLNKDERVSSRNITIDRLIAAAKRILHPYTLDVKEVAWWSVYDIGQRLCDKFDDAPSAPDSNRTPRVFLAGDSCHTHSPKAGQGMNVSMQDAFNLGWKLSSVLLGRAAPGILQTYSAERHAVAKELIEFDREWARLLSAPARSADQRDGAASKEVQDYFVRHGRYTAGTATRYRPSVICASPRHQHLAKGLVVGMRFHSGPVARLADAMPMRLGDTLKADGRWRIFAFADRQAISNRTSRLRVFCEFLAESDQSPVRKYTPGSNDIDSIIDVRAVLQEGHRDVDLEQLPEFLLPHKGRYGLVDYEKVFCPDIKAGKDIFDLRGIDRDAGCAVVIRPDQYIAHVVPLDGFLDLGAFFDAFMLPPGEASAFQPTRVSEVKPSGAGG